MLNFFFAIKDLSSLLPSSAELSSTLSPEWIEEESAAQVALYKRTSTKKVENIC